MLGSKPKETPAELGAKVANAVNDLVSKFYELRVSPLQQGLADVFASSLDKAIEQHGLDANVIRKEYADLELAWTAGLLDMKPELLDFREMQDWLKCAESVGVRDDMLDWMDHQFDQFSDDLRILAVGAIGGRVLLFELEEDE